MDKILKTLNINQPKITIKPKKENIFNKVKNGVPPIENYNFQADLLHLPTTKYRYKYLVVIVDLWSNNFDIEPIRNKTPADVLKAMKKIMTREYIPDIKASLRTDSGTEFRGIFHKAPLMVIEKKNAFVSNFVFIF